MPQEAWTPSFASSILWLSQHLIKPLLRYRPTATRRAGSTGSGRPTLVDESDHGWRCWI